MIQNAIETQMQLEFMYYSPRGEMQRSIEPYYLIFRWSNWYVWGWCRAREDFRLFKLNRMDRLQLWGDKFQKREVPMPDLSNEKIFPGGIKVKALFEPDCKWRLVEEFGTGCFEEQADGRLLFHGDYTNKEDFITWIFTFRDKAVLLDPDDIREEIQLELKKMAERYSL